MGPGSEDRTVYNKRRSGSAACSSKCKNFLFLSKRLKELEDAQVGEIGGMAFGGGTMKLPQDPGTPLKSGYWTFDHEDGETLVVETRRYKDGHELAIVESIRNQDGHLIYKHEITGPQGKRDERDIVFSLS
jgi:hypothetical protein